ncbi:hypothetical protein, partial [Plasmodium yoelii yoelii]
MYDGMNYIRLKYLSTLQYIFGLNICVLDINKH